MQTGAPLFELTDVSYRYPEGLGSNALSAIDLRVFADDTIALIGAVGSGKSTLLKLLVGLIRPGSGTILFDGEPLPRRGRKIGELHRRVGIVFQSAEAQVFEATVLDEVTYGLKNFNFLEDEVGRLAEEALKKVGIPAEIFGGVSPFELSGGERRRLVIASVLAFQPEMLLLDEPGVGLDSRAKRTLMQILKGHKSGGKGLILVTHDLDLAGEICDKIAILCQGGLVYYGGREILYEFDKLKAWGLHPPELIQEWRELMDTGQVPKEKIYSMAEVEMVLNKIKAAD
jgi:energy-coupling factor transport system ATP-binding protein